MLCVESVGNIIRDSADDTECSCECSGAECRPAPGGLRGLMSVSVHVECYLEWACGSVS